MEHCRNRSTSPPRCAATPPDTTIARAGRCLRMRACRATQVPQAAGKFITEADETRRARRGNKPGFASATVGPASRGSAGDDGRPRTRAGWSRRQQIASLQTVGMTTSDAQRCGPADGVSARLLKQTRGLKPLSWQATPERRSRPCASCGAPRRRTRPGASLLSGEGNTPCPAVAFSATGRYLTGRNLVGCAVRRLRDSGALG
jgi:hypothetical protein